MTDIPAWAMEEAEFVYLEAFDGMNACVEIIARALVKAYENGWHDRAGTMTPESHEPGSDTVRKYV